jgi:hypothetical protein
MKEIEELLRNERNAGMPEPPDARYTMAVVRHRLGIRPEPHRRGRESEWLLVAAALCLVVVAFLCFGFSPWWLTALSAAALSMTPILLRKGA